MIRVAAFALPLSLVGCAQPPIAAGAGPSERIISVDYCADQMLLGLVDRSRIAAVSQEAASDPALARAIPPSLARATPRVEAVLALRPTLVVRSYGGGPGFAEALARAGVPIVTLPAPDRLADVDEAIAKAGHALGADAAATARRAQLRAVLARVSTASSPVPALYLTPGDVTTGPGGLIDDMLRAGGVTPYETRPGWHNLPLEQLAARPPALVVRAFFDSPRYQQDAWSSAHHQLLRRVIASVPSVDVKGGDVACGNWRIGHAIAAIAAARARLP